ncbi:MAG: RHS repeat-associated core domain-containing protein [bacterium]|nr:RHS repeat-associated core domain-containing protein [bacterium]
MRVAKARDGVLSRLHSDHLHSATILTDAAGAELRRLAYRAFGEEAENVGSGSAPKYSYTGKELDNSGLMYYGARYYDPTLSRFITADTVYDAGPQGLNRYSYALNNPIRYNDPSGHQVESQRYFHESSYDFLPYAGEVDSGNAVVDHAGALVGGMYNFGAGVANALLGGATAGEDLVEAGYNAGTEAVLGRKGFTGEGFEGDWFALESSGLPVGASLAQGLKHSAPLLKGKLTELGKSLGNVGLIECGSRKLKE